jgi:two-component system phosphate regulon response regulator PhoB
MSSAPQPTILVVDDYVDALEVWRLYLMGQGFRVLTAEDGRAALAFATAEVPDLIIMDFKLPDMSGLDVARELRADARTRAIPLIGATGFSQPSHLDEAERAGFDVVTVKPCDPATLLVEIKRLLAARSSGPSSQPGPRSA